MPNELTEQQQENCKRLLLERKQELREAIRQELLQQDNEHYSDLAETVHGLEEESFADLIVDLKLADVDRHIEESRDIYAALLRIEDGSYGTCISCSGQIALERLQAYPTARRCLTCQQQYERTHQTSEVHTL